MPRDTLTREQIVGAAVAVLDDEGVAGLSMRRLGARLGSAPTAVYWHVTSKDELVTLAGDHVWREIDLPDPTEMGWRAAAAALATGARAMVGRHLWLTSTMTTHFGYGPAEARYDDRCLAVYEAAGFSEADADRAAATMRMFLVGTARNEADEVAWRRRTDATTAGEHPRSRRTEPPGQDTFEFGLTAILDGLAARLADR